METFDSLTISGTASSEAAEATEVREKLISHSVPEVGGFLEAESTVSCFLTAPISLTGCTDSERLDLEEARLGGAVRGREGRPNEADLEGEMRSPLAPRGSLGL